MYAFAFATFEDLARQDQPSTGTGCTQAFTHHHRGTGGEIENVVVEMA